MENTKTQVLRLKNRRPELGSKIYELAISTLLVLLLPEQGSHYTLGKSTDLGIGSPKNVGKLPYPINCAYRGVCLSTPSLAWEINKHLWTW